LEAESYSYSIFSKIPADEDVIKNQAETEAADEKDVEKNSTKLNGGCAFKWIFL